MFEARLEQGALLKKLLDAVKELVTDANFDCSATGFGLQAMDSSHVSLVSMMVRREEGLTLFSSVFGVPVCTRTKSTSRRARWGGGARTIGAAAEAVKAKAKAKSNAKGTTLCRIESRSSSAFVVRSTPPFFLLFGARFRVLALLHCSFLCSLGRHRDGISPSERRKRRVEEHSLLRGRHHSTVLMRAIEKSVRSPTFLFLSSSTSSPPPLQLRSDGFEHYRCDRNLSMGINLNNMAKMLKCANNDDTVTMKVRG
jgi:hypothetical protein